jgi:hypothetical protein
MKFFQPNFIRQTVIFTTVIGVGAIARHYASNSNANNLPKAKDITQAEPKEKKYRHLRRGP